MEEVNFMNEEKKPVRPPKKPARKRHGADFGLRIVAVIAAIIVWFILSITQYPTINRTISDVPVNISLDNTIAKEKGLSALNFKDLSVDVEIKGMNYEIGTYTAGDLIASVDVSKVTKEGQYVLDIDVKSSHSSDSCTIVSVKPSTVVVDFDRITQKNVPLEVEAPSISAAEGYTLKDKTVNGTYGEMTFKDGVAEWEYLACMDIRMTDSGEEKTTFEDAEGNSITEEDYNSVVEKRFAGMEQSEFKPEWTAVTHSSDVAGS